MTEDKKRERKKKKKQAANSLCVLLNYNILFLNYPLSTFLFKTILSYIVALCTNLMDVSKGKEKKGNLIIKTWERCRSLGHGSKRISPRMLRYSSTAKSRSWPRIDLENGKSPRKKQVAPEGCFSVYVGPQKQKFVIKTEYANHPLFKTLLEEAESEYGFNTEGPLELPCNVDIFWKVLLEIEYEKDEIPGRGFSMRSYGSYRLLSPSRLVAMNHF